jgi:polyisoprenoid-binding protein YceI
VALTPSWAQVFTIAAEESTLSFVGAKATRNHSGGFERFAGTFTLEDGDLSTLQLRVEIDTTSLWADVEDLQNHLKSADFFDVESHPTATFESVSVSPYGDQWMVTGELDLHGVTSRLSFPLSIQVERADLRAQASFDLFRYDFGISLAGRPGDLIKNAVAVSFDVSATAEEE